MPCWIYVLMGFDGRTYSARAARQTAEGGGLNPPTLTIYLE